MSIIIFALLFLVGCLGAMAWQSARYGKQWFQNFGVEVAFSEEQVGEGDTVYLYETVTNDKDMILPAVCVKFKTSRHLSFGDLVGGAVSDYFYRNDVLSVREYEKVRRKLKCKCTKRGEYWIKEAEIVGNDYFLRNKYLEKIEVDAHLIVYPAMLSVERIVPVFQKSYGEMRTQIPMFEDPFEYVGVRDYMPGDSMGRIHWKASARTGIWQVKTSAYTAAEPVVILLNLESPGTFINYNAMEENIRIAYSLLYYLDQQGVLTTLVVNGDETLRLSGNGRGHMSQVRRRLATVSYEKVTKKGQEMIARERDTLSPTQHVFFVSSAAKPETQTQLSELIQRGHSVTWVATIFGGEDDTKDMAPGLEPYLYRWKG